MRKELLPKTKNKEVQDAAKIYFVQHIPNNLDFAMRRGYNELVQWHMNLLDYFQYHFRAYVCGKSKTTHRVYYEIRNGLREGMPKEYFTACMNVTEGILKEFELYEYMERFYSLKSKCEKVIKKPDY